jgi:hypothetical protein
MLTMESQIATSILFQEAITVDSSTHKLKLLFPVDVTYPSECSKI